MSSDSCFTAITWILIKKITKKKKVRKNILYINRCKFYLEVEKKVFKVQEYSKLPPSYNIRVVQNQQQKNQQYIYTVHSIKEENTTVFFLTKIHMKHLVSRLSIDQSQSSLFSLLSFYICHVKKEYNRCCKLTINIQTQSIKTIVKQ